MKIEILKIKQNQSYIDLLYKIEENIEEKSKKESDLLKGKWSVEYQLVLDELIHNFGFSSLEELKKKGTQKHLKEYFILERDLLEKFAEEKSDLIKKKRKL